MGIQEQVDALKVRWAKHPLDLNTIDTQQVKESAKMNTAIYLDDCYELSQTKEPSPFYTRLFKLLKNTFKDGYFTKQQAFDALEKVYKRLYNRNEAFKVLLNSDFIKPVKISLNGNFLMDKNLLSVYAQRFSICPSEFNLRYSCYLHFTHCHSCSEKTGVAINVFKKIYSHATILDRYDVEFNNITYNE